MNIFNASYGFSSLKDIILSDGGHAYAETNLSNFLVEPTNAITALIFFFVAVFWLLRLRKMYKKYMFLAVSMAVLVIGGLGGALFHGFRSHELFLLMDVVPIYGLAVASAVWLWYRILPSWTWMAPILGIFLIIHFYLIPGTGWEQAAKNSAEYLNLTATLLFPLVAVLVKTKFRYYKFALGALMFFAAAITFRISDWDLVSNISIGTHFLWHVFGAIACALFAEYLFRLMTLRLRALRRGVKFDAE
ncbi:MAG: hypothetical protein H6581_06650 [Bacteroidia bacterium]|nr:hypothetical protein [Bacteroidia bacterium]